MPELSYVRGQDYTWSWDKGKSVFPPKTEVSLRQIWGRVQGLTALMSPGLVPSENRSFYGGTTPTPARAGHRGAQTVWLRGGTKGQGQGPGAVSSMQSAWTPVFPFSLFVD